MLSTKILIGLLGLVLSVSSAAEGHRRQNCCKPKKHHRRPCPPKPCYSSSTSSSMSCSRTSSSQSCSMSVSWEESEVKGEVIRRRQCNPKHRLYYCPPPCSSSSSSSWTTESCPSTYTTIEIIRPHIVRHHKRKVRVREEVQSLPTEIEVIKKKVCCKPSKPKYVVVNKCRKPKCKKEPKCSKKPKCKKNKSKSKGCRKH